MNLSGAQKIELAVGFFDGVHLGHQRLLNAMLERARETSAKPVAFTFTNHPTLVFAPQRTPKLLTTSEERFFLLKKYGVEEITALDFTEETAARSPEQFAEYLRGAFPGLDTVFCGPNWTFGCGGAGNAAFLRKKGFRVDEVQFAEAGGEVVSSTRIRRALSEGKLDEAAKMLGRRYSVSGKVFSGKGMGRSIGFPTVNLHSEVLRSGLLPLGVYQVETDAGCGIANLGFAPTMEKNSWESPVLEVHLLSCGEGGTVRFADGDKFNVSFLRYIRPEKKFDSIDSLRLQINSDIESIRGMIGEGCF